MEGLLRDLRVAFRQIAQRPAVSAVAVVTLGLGMAAAVVLFTLLNALVLRSLPVHAPERLVAVSAIDRNGQYSVQSVETFRALASQQHVFASVSGYVGNGVATIEIDGTPSASGVDAVTGEYFRVLGLAPVLGRFIIASDVGLQGEGSSTPVVVISHGFWQRRFGGDRDVLGTLIRIEGIPFTVIGVAPPAFSGLHVGAPTDLTVPITMLPRLVGLPMDIDSLWIGYAIGRLRDGITVQQAQAQVQARWSAILSASIPTDLSSEQRAVFLSVRPLVESVGRGLSTLRERYERPLYVLLGLTAWMMLITCANLAGLLTARMAAREQELSIRLALGASRWHLIRQLLVESVTLSAVGTAVGLPFAWWGARAFVSGVAMGPIPVELKLTPDLQVWTFIATVSIATGLLFGVSPAYTASRRDPCGALANGRTVVSVVSRRTQAFAVAQIALSLVMLVVAGVLVLTMLNLLRLHPGYRTDGVLIGQLMPQPGGYANVNLAQYYRELVTRLAAVPGVRLAALSDAMPAAGVAVRTEEVSRSRIPPSGTPQTVAQFTAVSPGFFDTMEITRLQGRDFTWHDDDRGPRVAIVTEELAQRLFPGGKALGQQLRVGMDPARAALEIVGIVRDAALSDIRASRRRIVFVPFTQEGRITPVVVIQALNDSTVPVDTVRATIRSLGREYAPNLHTLEAQLNVALFPERAAASISMIFGGLGTLLVFICIYALLHYHVTQRSREMGIRLALGASPGALRASVVWVALRLTLLGVSIGAPLAMATAGVTDRLLFGVGAQDPRVLFGAILLLIAISLVAGYAPARMASRVRPMEALRSE